MEKVSDIAKRSFNEVSQDEFDEYIDSGIRPVTVKRPTIDELDTSHHPLVEAAVKAAKEWAVRKIGGFETISLVLVATQKKNKDGSLDPYCTGYGVGKTHIARCIQWSSYHYIDDHEPVAPNGQFYTAADLMELLGDGQEMEDLAPPWTDTSYGRFGGTVALVIDDVGTEGILPYVAAADQEREIRTRYFKAINYCYRRKISVVLTANMRLEMLGYHIGGRAWSRLMEMAPAGFMVDMTGVPDWRRRQGGR